jgi:hypothetical protein
VQDILSNTVAPNNIAVSNPITELATGVVNVGAFLLDDRFNLDLELEAAESEGEGKVISSPRVVTLDNRKASIEQGVSIPFQTFENGDAKLEFIDAVLRLDVTPHITQDRSIIMQIEVQRNAPDDSVPTPTGSPAIAKNEAKTETLVRDGQTLVIGGIYVVRSADRQTRVPFLYKIPIIGNAFKNNETREVRQELLVFVTPRVVVNPKPAAEPKRERPDPNGAGGRMRSPIRLSLCWPRARRHRLAGGDDGANGSPQWALCSRRGSRARSSISTARSSARQGAASPSSSRPKARRASASASARRSGRGRAARRGRARRRLRRSRAPRSACSRAARSSTCARASRPSPRGSATSPGGRARGPRARGAPREAAHAPGGARARLPARERRGGHRRPDADAAAALVARRLGAAGMSAAAPRRPSRSRSASAATRSRSASARSTGWAPP